MCAVRHEEFDRYFDTPMCIHIHFARAAAPFQGTVDCAAAAGQARPAPPRPRDFVRHAPFSKMLFRFGHENKIENSPSLTSNAEGLGFLEPAGQTSRARTHELVA